MAKGFSLTHTIPASPDAVFAVLRDLDQAQTWMPSIQKIQKLTEGPMAKGSKWIETRMTPRGPFVSTVTVEGFEPGKTFAISADNKKAHLSFKFELASEGAGTKVTSQAEGKLKGLMGPFSGMIVKQMKAEDADILARLEKQVAAQASKGKAPTGKETAGAKAAGAAGKDKATKAAKPAKAAEAAKTAKAGTAAGAKGSKAAAKKGAKKGK